MENSKSAGCDSLRTEHLKYAPDVIHEHIADLLNSTAETGEYPKEIKLDTLQYCKKQEKRKVHQKI